MKIYCNFANPKHSKMKFVFFRITQLVFHTEESWERIVAEKENMSFVRRHFFLPCLFMVLVLSSVGVVIDYNWFGMDDWSDFLKKLALKLFLVFCVVFVGTYVGFLIVNFIIRYLLGTDWSTSSLSDENGFLSTLRQKRMEKSEDFANCFEKCYLLVVYSSVPLWVVMLLVGLIPSLFFLRIFYFYVAYVVWTALPILFPDFFTERGRKLLSIVIFVILIFCPIMVERVLSF